jgi:hypothetical protein
MTEMQAAGRAHAAKDSFFVRRHALKISPMNLKRVSMLTKPVTSGEWLETVTGDQ